MTIKTAVIGIGSKGWSGWGWKANGMLTQRQTHIGCVIDNKEMELVAVADIDEGTLKAFADLWTLHEDTPNPPTYTDYQKMLTVEKPEAVIIATPSGTHASIARNVARYASIKAVLLEKPVAEKINDAEDVRITYTNFKIPCIVNHSRRWHPAWTKAKRLIKSLGGCHNVMGVCNGEPLDAGSHMADLFRMIAPKANFHYIDAYLPHKGKYHPYLLFNVVAYCEDGVVNVGDNGCYISVAKRAASNKYRDLKELDWVDYYNFDYRMSNETAMMKAVDELRLLAQGKKKKPICGIEDGLAAVRLALRWKYGMTDRKANDD